MPSICLIDTLMQEPPFGGPSSFLIRLSSHLKDRGWETSVVSQRGPSPRIRNALTGLGISVVDDLWQPWHLPEEKAEFLRRWVETTRPDLYVISNCRDVSWLALPFLPERTYTVSVAHHDVGAYYDPVRHYSGFLDRMIGVSPQITSRLSQLASGNGDRCRYIPYGVDVSPQEQIARKTSEEVHTIRIIYVGRLVQDQKRIMSLPLLARELADRNLPFHLDIVGDGPDRDALVRAINSAGVSQHVSFQGWLDGDPLRRRLREADVFVLLSDAEGLPIAMLEAMGHGAVPVVTDIDCGIKAVVRDGQNGFLVPRVDIGAYAGRIEVLYKDKSLRRDMQLASWATSNDYSVGTMGAAYHEIFHRLLAAPSIRISHPQADKIPPMVSCRSRYPRPLRKIKSYVLNKLK